MTIWIPEPGADDGPRYLAIVSAIERDVAAGRLRLGDRLPTHRELAAAMRIAIGTATRAYAEAERRGLIHGEVGRGTFVGTGQRDPVLLTVAEGGSADLIELGLNVPLYDADPDLAAVLRGLARRRDVATLLRYQPHAGTARHRAAGAAWATRFGLRPTPDQVVVCAGAQHATTVALATLARPGDRILAEALTSPALMALTGLLHLRLEGIAMDAEGLLPDALEDALRHDTAKVLCCMPTLQNPTAGILSEPRRREIAAIARAHDIAIIEDDVHRLLVPGAPPPIARFAPERSYYIAGTSKSVAGGLRTAFLVAPPGMAGRLAQAAWATIWMATPLTAEIAATWIEDGTADRAAERKRREAAARQRIAAKILGHLRYRAQPCAYHVWLELPEPWRGEAFAREARRRGVVVTPAEAFALGQGPVAGAVRVSLSAARDREQLASALEILAEILGHPPMQAPGIL
jgi:DNA-binding transcriptional MocR family regulator